MKFPLAIIAAAMLLHASSFGADPPIDEKFNAQVVALLTKIVKLKPGDTRKKLLELFRTEGGFSSPEYRAFVYKECPYIKVLVTFDLTAPGRESPTDKIKTISNPYLEFLILE